jgi:hypothetical protein
MKTRILSLIGALALCLVALTNAGAAQNRSSCNCAKLEAQCLTGCPCAEFYCNATNCSSQCVCPIFCPQSS